MRTTHYGTVGTTWRASAFPIADRFVAVDLFRPVALSLRLFVFLLAGIGFCGRSLFTILLSFSRFIVSDQKLQQFVQYFGVSFGVVNWGEFVVRAKKPDGIQPSHLLLIRPACHLLMSDQIASRERSASRAASRRNGR
jgi:hypothetical protein